MRETKGTTGARRSVVDAPAPARVGLVVIHGAALAINAHLLSRWADGLFGAAMYLLALTAATLTAGVVVAALIGVWDERPHVPRTARSGPTIPCHSCGGVMIPSGPGWICEACDR